MRIIFVLIIFSTFVFAQVDSIDSANSQHLQGVSLTDSLQSNISEDIGTQRTHHSWINIAAQAFISTQVGSYCAVVPIALAQSDVHSGNRAVACVLFGTAAVAYVLGSALGVKWTANVENENGSYWKTAQYSGIGAICLSGVSFIVARLYNKSAIMPTYLGFIGGTLIGGVFYSTCLAPWNSDEKTVASAKKISSQKDLIDSAKLFEIRLLQIPL